MAIIALICAICVYCCCHKRILFISCNVDAFIIWGMMGNLFLTSVAVS